MVKMIQNQINKNSMISEEYEKVNSKYVDASVFDAEHSEAIIFSFAVYVC